VVSAGAPVVINLLFGGRFEMAGPILRVLIWNVVWFFLNVPLVRFMMAANGQATVFRVLLISLSVNLVANLILIPRFGPLGPAYARLLSSGLFTAIMAGVVGRRLLRPAGVPAV
jgi:O-antigen/teichoic acid export membrane protein